MIADIQRGNDIGVKRLGERSGSIRIMLAQH